MQRLLSIEDSSQVVGRAMVPLVPTLMGGVFLLSAAVVGTNAAGFRGGTLMFILAVLAIIDIRHRIVPDILLGVGTFAGVVFLVSGGTGVVTAVPAALFAALFVFAIRVIGMKMSGAPGMGMGDVKLAFVVGLFMGYDAIGIFYFAMCLAGVWGGAGIAIGKLERRSRIPFVPFVAVAAALYPWVVSWVVMWIA
jgi:leader peptidase (prepilin peptidase) / N-methyltransferase